MSRRLKITLPESITAQLEDLAASTGEPVSRVAAQMVRERLADVTAGGHARAARVTPAAVDREGPEQRPSWLEPYGGDPDWRSSMWGGIVALHGRYPTALAGLKDGWWESGAHMETLCALVVWRQWLDDAGRDPREELAFQIQLADYGQMLRQEGGGVTRAWSPGAPPAGWAY